MYDYGLIGNCQTSALVSQTGSIDWWCVPRPDSPPVFGRIIDCVDEGDASSEAGGFFAIETENFAKSRQEYLHNTNILVTHVTTKDGAEFKITDFCPRFEQHGRMYRPNSIFRIVEPVSGSPLIRVRCRPVNGWEKQSVQSVRGNSHIRWEVRREDLRLLTNMSLTYLIDETPFLLKEPAYFALTWSSGLEEDLTSVAHKFLDATATYWRTWVKHCSIPSSYQKETIRSALALKLHCYEDTGAILAALTTSLPEEVGQTRNWDYRFCWLRDAYFVLSAFHNLGHFEEMEGFLKYLLNIAHQQEYSKERLRPVYTLDAQLPLPENEHKEWLGFRGSSPVRSNNQAAEHVQNDVYGEMILAFSPIFFDERFHHLRTHDHEELLVNLYNFCVNTLSQPDAGLWEIRNGWQEHSFSNLMCWAGIERIHRIKDAGYLRFMDQDVNSARKKALSVVERAVVEGVLRNGPTDQTLDASLLQLPLLRYPNNNLCRNTVMSIVKRLSVPGSKAYLYRYLRQDDFGVPQSAFLVCSFWAVQALSRIGEIVLAKQAMDGAMLSANSLGLFAEHYLPEKHIQRGNFPQAYSHVGQINAAFAVSPPWHHVL